ncbi:MAG: hypothetical protein V1494_01610 [Candidatus Diapherotrites archaeon]
MSNPWDLLRPLTGLAEQLDFYTSAIVLILALALLLISFKAYKKNKTQRLLLVSGAFFLFALKGAIGLIDLFYSPGLFFAEASQNVVDFLILALLFFALLRK